MDYHSGEDMCLPGALSLFSFLFSSSIWMDLELVVEDGEAAYPLGIILISWRSVSRCHHSLGGIMAKMKGIIYFHFFFF